MEFVVSDESINTYGFRIMTDGIDTSRFLKNPVMLYDHDSYQRLPIGTWSNLNKATGQLKAKANFDEKDDFAQKIKGKAEQKIIRMASIGVIPIEWSDDPKLMLPGQKRPTLTKCILREISITPFGSNHNAFRLYDQDGNEMNLSEATKLFDEKTPKPKSTKTMEENNLKILLTSGLNLSQNTSDAELARHCLNLSQKVSTLETEKKDLEKKLSDIQKEKEVELKEKLVNQAVADKKITEKQKPAYLSLSHDQAKALLDSIEKPQNLSDFPEQKPAAGNERKEWTFSDWSKRDPQGLEELKEKDKEYYSRLFKAEYGVEPQV